MTEPLDFTGRTVIVTGGTQGVGRGIAECFLGAGASVVICARNPPTAEVVKGGRKARFIAANVRDPDAVRAVVEQAVAEYGGLSVLVNNAGGSPAVAATEASPRFFSAIVDLNLTAAFTFSQVAYPELRKTAQACGLAGAIVNIASVSGVRPSPGTAAYGAAKAGLLNLTQSLGIEWAPDVRVNAVVAGLVQTEQALSHYGGEAGVRAVAKTVPLGRMAEPEDIGGACLYLASPLASYVTGACLSAHGGGETPAFLRAADECAR